MLRLLQLIINETGGVVDAEFTFSDPSDIDPNQTAPFDVTLTSSRVPYVDGYELTAESTQYALIPEFPSFFILPLFMIATLLAVIIYRRKHSM